MTTQALSVAVSNQGLTKLFNALVVSGPEFANNLNQWVPTSPFSLGPLSVGNLINYYITLTGGTASNASATLTTVTQAPGTSEFILSFSVDITVTYQSWNEQGVNVGGQYPSKFGPTPCGSFSFTATGIVLDAFVEIAQSSGQWQFTYVGAGCDASNATIPVNPPTQSMLHKLSVGPCGSSTIASSIEPELEGLSYSDAVQSAIQPVLQSLSESGQLTQYVNFQWTPNTFTFPPTQVGLETGVTGDVLFSNELFPGAGVSFTLPPSVIPDLNDQQVDPTITQTFQQFGIALNDPTVTSVTAGQAWTIANGSATYTLDYSGGSTTSVSATGGGVFFAISPSAVADLDSGTIDATVKTAFAGQNITLSSDAEVFIIKPGQQWTIYNDNVSYELQYMSGGGGSPPLIAATGGGVTIVLPSSVIPDLDDSQVDSTITSAFTAFGAPLESPTVTTVTAGQQWTIQSGSSSYTLQAGTGQPAVDVQGQSTIIAASVVPDLDNGLLDTTVIGAFGQSGIDLPDTATVAVVTLGSQWTVTNGSTTYTLQYSDPQVVVTSTLPLPDVSLPTSINESYDVEFYATDYLFSALYWAFAEDQKLGMTITKGMLAEPAVLNTAYYQSSIPDLYQQYKDADMQVIVSPLSPPLVSFVPAFELPFPYIITPPVLASLAASLPAPAIAGLRSIVGEGYTNANTFTSAVNSGLGDAYAPLYSETVVSAATTPAMVTLSGLMADDSNANAYPALLTLCGQPFFTADALQTACLALPSFEQSDWTNYGTDITAAAQTVAAQFTHTPTCTYQVLSNGSAVTVFVIQISEVDILTNFQFGVANGVQTIQCDYQILGQPIATLTSSNIADVNPLTFGDIWTGSLGLVYGQIVQNVAATGVPVPWIEGYTLQESMVTLQPGYADVVANVAFGS